MDFVVLTVWALGARVVKNISLSDVDIPEMPWGGQIMLIRCINRVSERTAGGGDCIDKLVSNKCYLCLLAAAHFKVISEASGRGN